MGGFPGFLPAAGVLRFFGELPSNQWLGPRAVLRLTRARPGLFPTSPPQWRDRGRQFVGYSDGAALYSASGRRPVFGRAKSKRTIAARLWRPERRSRRRLLHPRGARVLVRPCSSATAKALRDRPLSKRWYSESHRRGVRAINRSTTPAACSILPPTQVFRLLPFFGGDIGIGPGAKSVPSRASSLGRRPNASSRASGSCKL